MSFHLPFKNFQKNFSENKNIINLPQTNFYYMTPSLANFLGSLFWGTLIVIVPVTFALIVISRLDPINRED